MTERINLSIKTEEYLRMSDMLQFVNKSRQENPNPDILARRRQQLEESPRFTEKDIEAKILIDEVAIRLSAALDSGVSTFEIFEMVESDKERHFDRAEIQHEIWNLVDSGILSFSPERRLKLSTDIQL